MTPDAELDAGIDALRGLAEAGRRHFTDGTPAPDGIEDVLFVMIAPVCPEIVE